MNFVIRTPNPLSGLFRFAFLIIAFYFLPVQSKAFVLSDSSRISLLTCAPGDELYSAFGHNGIRVTDFKEGWDVVFNYGTFDDTQEGFYVNFVKGRMIYSVSYSSYGDFLEEYVEEKRGVVEQELRLNPEDRKKVFAFLYENALPQNRNYPYDFFWDNCATRPRDVFEKALGSRLQYQTDSGGFQKNKTMHDMLRLYVHDRPWVDFGFDLILGLPCEVIATPRSQTFLPDYLSKLFACASVDGQPFVVQTKTVLNYPLPKIEAGFTPMHLTLLLLFLGIAFTLLELKLKRHLYLFDFFIFFVAGLFGLLFLCMWLFTTHYSVPKNLNMLWMIPTHLIVVFLFFRNKPPRWLRFYFLATFILMIILLLGWRFNPQPCSPAAAPFIVLLALRAFGIYRDTDPNKPLPH
ncbi:MAG: hypothetical protein JWO06_756 [Bacteroidota bacterium]|nr:hypothetical protein [Bacteroidota bacterium]